MSAQGQRAPIGSQNQPLQQDVAPGYALIVSAGGVAVLVDVSDRPGRLLGIVYGENDQLQQLTPADAAAPNESLEVTGFNMVWDAVAGDWNRLREGSAIGEALVDLSDRAARLVGIVYGEADQLQQSAPADAHANPADALEVGAFPHVYDPVAGDWNMQREGAAIGQALTDPADRAAREVGKVQLTDFVDDGEVYPDGSIPIAPAKTTMASFDALANVAVVGSAGNLALNTDHRGMGTNSVEWDKIAGGVLGGVVYTPPVAIDIGVYSTHAKVMAFMYIPTPVGGTITNLYIALGTDAGNLWFWEIPMADIVYDAWHHYHRIMSEIDGDAGVGANLSAITYVGVFVTTSVVGATLTNILVDEVIVKRSSEVLINQLEGDPLITEDLGTHTNPRRLESDYGFWSAPTAVVGPAATALWTAVTTPARTAGLDTTIYTIEIENSTGAPVTAWLEIGGVVITVPFHVGDNDSVTIPYVAGFATGDNDVNCNASAAGVNVSIKGIEL